MARDKPRGHLVRIDPEIFLDVDLGSCSRDARFSYIDSLFYLAAAGDPSGLYPHTALVAEMGSGASGVTAELTRLGVWVDFGLGYQVVPYSGCRVVPEYRQPIDPKLRQRIYERDGYRCVTCGAIDQLTLDHIYPWSLGGPDTEENLQTLCQPCNSRKGARV